MTGAAGERWRPAYVGIGSNLDSPTRQVSSAFDALAVLPGCRLVARSSLYESAPVGPPNQPNYVNAAAAVLTTLEAPSLLAQLQRIELAHGRERGAERWGPRTLDLDLLVFSGLVCDEPGLVLPHPRIAERNFVLLPLEEIAPHLVIPGLGSVTSLAAKLDNNAPEIEKL